MKYLYKFKFISSEGSGDICSCEPYEYNFYKISWQKEDGHVTSGSARHYCTSVEDFIKNGYWVMETTNGVDAEGNPLNFTKADLKPFMRVVLRDGTTYIVVENHSDKFFARENGYSYSKPNENLLGAYTANDVVKVYDYPPQHNHILISLCKGKLLWKRVEAPVKTEQEIAIEALEKSIKDSQDKLIELKKTL